jgi:L-lactate dehydrogenase (cytochrome)
MAASGEKGVTNVLEILRSGIDETLLGLAKSSIHDVGPDDLLVPSDFTRSQK